MTLRLWIPAYTVTDCSSLCLVHGDSVIIIGRNRFKVAFTLDGVFKAPLRSWSTVQTTSWEFWLFVVICLFIPFIWTMAETSKGVNAGKLASNVQKRINRAQEKVREWKTPCVLIDIVLFYSRGHEHNNKRKSFKLNSSHLLTSLHLVSSWIIAFSSSYFAFRLWGYLSLMGNFIWKLH